MKDWIIKLLGGYTQEQGEKLLEKIDQLKYTNGLVWADYATLVSQTSKEKKPHNTLEEFKLYLEDNIKEYRKYHTNSDGRRFYPHKWLQTDKDTDELYDAWITHNELLFEVHNTDTAVYLMTRYIHDLLRKNGYSTDFQKWKEHEKWLSPYDAINILVFAGEKGDCEDYGILLHTAIRRMLVLRKEWEDNAWRLRSFLVRIIGAEYHYSVAWVKEGPNDWINLETTYAPELFDKCWNNDLSLTGNWLYDIDYSFDDRTSYKKI